MFFIFLFYLLPWIFAWILGLFGLGVIWDYVFWQNEYVLLAVIIVGVVWFFGAAWHKAKKMRRIDLDKHFAARRR